MTIKASGRSALILAAGFSVCLGVCFAGPSQAASAGAATASATPVALKHHKKYAHHKSGTLASTSDADTKAAPADATADDSDASPAIPPSVANANAELTASDSVPASNARAMTARAGNILQAATADAQPGAETQVVSADQLNDVDRALQSTPAAPNQTPNQTMASADAPAAPAAPVLASGSNDSSTWDQTSLIGKIFIGFGALLTMASAARMFMA
jgi:hypothetical protein